MNICIPRERRDNDYRVGMTPAGVRLLVQAGHTCYVEHDAGVGSGFADYDFQQAGAKIAYRGEEIYGRADLVLKVSRPTAEEFEWMVEGSMIAGFLHLASARPDKIASLIEKKITAIGFETIQDDHGTLPVLQPISQLAGRLVPQIAAHIAQNNMGGKGILLGGVPGVPPAEVVIIGAGTLGVAAALGFLGMNAAVYVLDQNYHRLQTLHDLTGGRVVTMVSHDFNVEKVVTFADVLVGAVLVPGARSPIVVSRQMVRTMRKRSIIMDLSIDQGGCIETSRPTTHSNPTYIDEDVIHFCVPNITGVLGRTATHVMNNATWPYVRMIANMSLEGALEAAPELKRGLYTMNGEVTHPVLRKLIESRS